MKNGSAVGIVVHPVTELVRDHRRQARGAAGALPGTVDAIELDIDFRGLTVIRAD